MTLYALTLYQPWAHLIVTGRKKIETRFWPTHIRGSIAIHAGKQIDVTAVKRFGLVTEPIDVGCIIGWADIIECRLLTVADESAACCECAGKWGFVLRGAMRSAKPIPCRGFQKFWTVPANIERQLLYGSAPWK